MREWLVLVVASLCSAYNGCLHQRSVCLRNTQCREYMDNFENTCSFSLNSCAIESPSDCVHLLWRIRDFFPYDTCVCYEALGSPEECNQFRELIWNHPCERRMTDAGEQRRLNERIIPALASENASSSHKRTTRTPLSDQIRQLKTQLSGDLGTRDVIGKATCDSALNDVCLRHISCRQLWSLFRASCGVDQDNRCTMADRETCWQSFEGLSWTGLGNCHCDSSNSDCHWIRLHTNYNKCIHEISRSGQFKSAGISHGQTSSHDRVVVPAVTAAPPRPVTTKPPSTTIAPTTTKRPPRIERPTTTPRPVPITTSWDRRRQQVPVYTRTTAPPWWHTTPTTSVHHSYQQRHIVPQTQADVHYRPLFEPQVKTTPTYYYYYTTAAPRWDQRNYPTTSSQNMQYSYTAASDGRQQVADPRYPSGSRWNVRQTQQPFRMEAKMDSMQHSTNYRPIPTQSSSTSFTQMEYSTRDQFRSRWTNFIDFDRSYLGRSF